jgi:hypothetical protein
MSNDNTQDDAEPSLASAGSRPVAWAVVQSERAPQPSLTGKEREAVQQAIDSGYGMEDAEPWALETLRELLKRLG